MRGGGRPNSGKIKDEGVKWLPTNKTKTMKDMRAQSQGQYQLTPASVHVEAASTVFFVPHCMDGLDRTLKHRTEMCTHRLVKCEHP